MSSYAIKMPSGAVWLVDCAEGTQIRILRSRAVKLSQIQTILVTHLHGDHCFGLPGLLCSLGNQRHADNVVPVNVVGPTGIAAFIDAALRLSGSYLPYPLHVIELMMDSGDVANAANDDHEDDTDAVRHVGDDESSASDSTKALRDARCVDMSLNVTEQENLIKTLTRVTPCEQGHWTLPPLQVTGGSYVTRDVLSVQAARLVHGVPCVGYVIRLVPQIGHVNAPYIKPLLEKNKDALMAAGVRNPLSLIANVKRGEDVVLPDGKKR